MKEIILTSDVKIQKQSENMYATLPSTVRSILKPKKGEIMEYVIYSDKTIEIRMKGE